MDIRQKSPIEKAHQWWGMYDEGARDTVLELEAVFKHDLGLVQGFAVADEATVKEWWLENSELVETVFREHTGINYSADNVWRYLLKEVGIYRRYIRQKAKEQGEMLDERLYNQGLMEASYVVDILCERFSCSPQELAENWSEWDKEIVGYLYHRFGDKYLFYYEPDAIISFINSDGLIADVPDDFQPYWVNQWEALHKNRAMLTNGVGHYSNIEATGTGKSKIAEEEVAAVLPEVIENGERVLIVAPRRSIVSRLQEQFSNYNIAHYSESPDVLTAAHIIITTIDTWQKFPEIMGHAWCRQVGKVIYDEAHTLTTDRRLSSTYYYPNATSLWMTATASYDEAKTIDAVVPRAATYTIEDGYEDGVIPKPEVISVTASLRMRNSRGSGFMDAVSTPNVLASVVQADAHVQRKLGEVGKIMVNCFNIDNANKLAEHYEEVGYRVGVVSSERSVEENEQVLNAFKAGEIDRIFQIDMLGMGVDIPELDAVIDFAATGSLVRKQQRFGRLTRGSVPKYFVEFGYVVNGYLLSRHVTAYDVVHGMEEVKRGSPFVSFNTSITPEYYQKHQKRQRTQVSSATGVILHIDDDQAEVDRQALLRVFERYKREHGYYDRGDILFMKVKHSNSKKEKHEDDTGKDNDNVIEISWEDMRPILTNRVLDIVEQYSDQFASRDVENNWCTTWSFSKQFSIPIFCDLLLQVIDELLYGYHNTLEEIYQLGDRELFRLLQAIHRILGAENFSVKETVLLALVNELD